MPLPILGAARAPPSRELLPAGWRPAHVRLTRPSSIATPKVAGACAAPFPRLCATVASAAIAFRRCRRLAMGASCARGADTKVVRSYFDGKVVWVTGASGGLGEALCVELCRLTKPRGLLLSARREGDLERVKRRCLELLPKGEIVVLPMDLADLSSLSKKAEVAVKQFGRVDVLVNNGGVGFRGVASETALELDQHVMNVDYFSGVALVKALLPGWLSARSGHVVQIASVQGLIGLPGRTAYSAAKHAAVGFYDSLRAELADTGVAVTTVCPGYIKTGHSLNAVRASDAGYPEGHTSKGADPDVFALETLAAVAHRRAELVSAALDAKIGVLLRVLCPSLLFWIMRRRARKELKERTEAQTALKRE